MNEMKIGENVFLGDYQGKKIEWRVLSRQGDKILLISEKCLDVQPYDMDWDNTTWETSYLRQWLNREFFNEAFSEAEREIILTTMNHTEDNPEYHTLGGKDTQDKVFLLSVQEAEKYFKSDGDRRTGTTEYAGAKKAYKDKAGYTWWWLRTMGFVSNCVTEVKSNGSIDLIGRLGNVTGCGNGTSSIINAIRPAIWVQL